MTQTPGRDPAASDAAPAPPATVVGMDIGGSKTRGLLIRGGAVVDERQAGSANTQSVSEQTAVASLRDLFAAFGDPRPDLVIAGSGGIDTAEDAQRLRDLIAPHAPGAEVIVVHDTRLTLAAGRTSTGVAVIAGTGSVAWGRNEAGRTARAGGWGYLLGDEGSGYWLAREAARAALHRFNLDQPVSPLGAGLLEACGLTDPEQLIAHFHFGTDRRYWAARSPVVYTAADEGDRDALRIIQVGAEHLADLATQVARQLGVAGPIVLGSGIGMHQPRTQRAFAALMADRGCPEVRVLDQEPVYGVLQLLADRAAGIVLESYTES
ncbi:ATPase, BadF/BadG/BcrA/BcrD type [Tersicoccus solisilvae]|uniref:ATPase, BadF/BadG/BcrA/BcrD type n=1 Tax=Tersicoccus solisilvae TaxID=1882339 RepID=A0ABQ1P560_9MICC|nr:BadF/BadG/BcrA/BcrD ATPase family protein [Tersicoccus solisilvae]GGC91030.1 ATPase, BadF/BadG/BcrA/BcrD type [Tersicoccus solisilvae]